ncbi:MAG: hypothetical protein ACE5JS_21195 [Nitrospinota bacterium]
MNFIVAKFLHVAAAGITFGGVVVMLWALMPSLGKVDSQAAATLTDLVGRRFRWMIWTVIVFLLGTGIWMIVLVFTVGVPGPLYHIILGVKILLALVIFAIALGITVPAKGLESMRQSRRRWMIIEVHLIVVVFFLGVWLGRM